jgi:hypothetical protein
MLMTVKHPGHDLVVAGLQVDLGGGQLGVAQHPLHVAQRQGGVGDHPPSGGVAQVMERPSRSEPGVGSLQDATHRRVSERSVGRPPGQPQRLLTLRARLVLLVEAEPHKAAAVDSPEDEEELVEQAGQLSLVELREYCRRTQAAAEPEFVPIRRSRCPVGEQPAARSRLKIGPNRNCQYRECTVVRDPDRPLTSGRRRDVSLVRVLTSWRVRQQLARFTFGIPG